MFRQLGQYCASYPWVIIVGWLVAGGVVTLVAPNWETSAQDDDVRFLPDRCTSVRAYKILQKAFPDDVFASRLVFAIERDKKKLTEKDFSLVRQMTTDLVTLKKKEPNLKIGSITSFEDPLIGSRLTSDDRQCTLIQVSLGSPFLAVQTRETVDQAQRVLQQRMKTAEPDSPRLYTTGQAGIGRDLVSASATSLDNTLIATIVLVIVILLIVYRAPLLAMVPLASIAVSVWVALKLLALMTLIPGVYLVNTSKVFAVVLLYGAGTDYCLFLISRYREELQNGEAIGGALSRAVGGVGGALAASAATVMCGLGFMVLAEFAKVRYSGPGIAICLGVTLLASLTLTPALLRLLGPVAFWPLPAPQRRSTLRMGRTNSPSGGVWEWISRSVARRPIVIWCASFALLLPLAVLGFQAQPDYQAAGQLAPTSESRQGLSALKKHFPSGETGPLTVLLTSPQPWDSPTGRVEIDHLTRGFAKLENVAEVRSLTRPLGKPLPDFADSPGAVKLVANLLSAVKPGMGHELAAWAQTAAAKHYVSAMPDDGNPETRRHVTRIKVVLKTDPYSPASEETTKRIQSWLSGDLTSPTLPKNMRSETYGVMVGAQDLAEVTESDRLRVNAMMVAGIFLILVLLVRQPVMAAYLLITVMLSYFAALGATMLAGYFWTGAILYHLDWRVMFFLFVILVAVGEDYNILLMSRAMQEQRRYGVLEGVRRALARTGGAITSCGLIMAGTFATLMLTQLQSLMQIGFALAFGVLLDTFIVRPFLVPTFAILAGKASAQPKSTRQLRAKSRRPMVPTPAPKRESVLDRVPPALRSAA